MKTGVFRIENGMTKQRLVILGGGESGVGTALLGKKMGLFSFTGVPMG